MRGAALVAGAIGAALLLTTALVWILEQYLGVADASPAYLLAVTVLALAFGTVPAAITAVGGVLVYNFLFTHPLYTFVVADAGQLLNLVLLLVVGIVVGRLAAAQRQRAEAAELREREALALVRVGRELATRSDTRTALRAIGEVLAQRLGEGQTWIALGDSATRERGVDERAPFQPPAGYAVLHRQPGDVPPRWTIVRPPAASGSSGAQPGDGEAYRVPIEAAGRPLGAVWTVRRRCAGAPSREETRMLAATADQIGQALEQDRLRSEAISAELARRSDAVKTALLESVSHELRTPLAAIRASAGTLADGGLGGDDAHQVAQSIDDEASRLDRLVGNLLDMSRIEGGALQLSPEPYALGDLLDAVMRRMRPRLAGRSIALDLPAELPYVMVDAVLLDQVVTNVLENSVRHAPAAELRIAARAATAGSGQPATVRLTIEDSGPGVPDEALPHLFDKFYRAPSHSSRGGGTGMGLAVVRGLVEAMSGRVAARRGDLGGLAIDVELPAVEMPEP